MDNREGMQNRAFQSHHLHSFEVYYRNASRLGIHLNTCRELESLLHCYNNRYYQEHTRSDKQKDFHSSLRFFRRVDKHYTRATESLSPEVQYRST